MLKLLNRLSLKQRALVYAILLVYTALLLYGSREATEVMTLSKTLLWTFLFPTVSSMIVTLGIIFSPSIAKMFIAVNKNYLLSVSDVLVGLCVCTSLLMFHQNGIIADLGSWSWALIVIGIQIIFLVVQVRCLCNIVVGRFAFGMSRLEARVEIVFLVLLFLVSAWPLIIL